MKVIHIILLKFKHQAIIQLRLILKSLFGCGEEPSVGNLVWLQQWEINWSLFMCSLLLIVEEKMKMSQKNKKFILNHL